MKDLLQILRDLRAKAKRYQMEVAQEYGIQEHETPVGIFAGIFNKVTLGIELISFYDQIWGNVTSTNCDSVEEARSQNGERIVTINRMIFVESLSFIEYHMKELTALDASFFTKKPNRIYLRNIVKEFKNRGNLSPQDASLWDSIIELRNCIVHNNAISDITGKYTFPNTVLELNSGKMTSGNLKHFPYLIDWILDSTCEVLKNYKNP